MRSLSRAKYASVGASVRKRARVHLDLFAFSEEPPLKRSVREPENPTLRSRRKCSVLSGRGVNKNENEVAWEFSESIDGHKRSEEAQVDTRGTEKQGKDKPQERSRLTPKASSSPEADVPAIPPKSCSLSPDGRPSLSCWGLARSASAILSKQAGTPSEVGSVESPPVSSRSNIIAASKYGCDVVQPTSRRPPRYRPTTRRSFGHTRRRLNGEAGHGEGEGRKNVKQGITVDETLRDQAEKLEDAGKRTEKRSLGMESLETLGKAGRAVLDDIQYALDGIFPLGGGVGGAEVVGGSLVMLLKNILRGGKEEIGVGLGLMRMMVKRVMVSELVNVSMRGDLVLGALAVALVRAGGREGWARPQVEMLVQLAGVANRRVGGVISGRSRLGRRRGLGVARRRDEEKKEDLMKLLREVVDKYGEGSWKGWRNVGKELMKVNGWEEGEGYGLQVRKVTSRFALEALGFLVDDSVNVFVRDLIGTDPKMLGCLVRLFDGFVASAKAEQELDDGMPSMALAGSVAHVLELVMMNRIGQSAVVRDGRIFEGIMLILSGFIRSLNQTPDTQNRSVQQELRVVEEGTVCSVLKLCINTIHRSAPPVESTVRRPNLCIAKFDDIGAVQAVYKILTHPKVSPCFDVRVLCLVFLTGCIEGGPLEIRESLSPPHFSSILDLLELDTAGMDDRVLRGYVCLLIGSICRVSSTSRAAVRERLGANSLLKIAAVLEEFWAFHKEVTGILGSAEETFARILRALVQPEGVPEIQPLSTSVCKEICIGRTL